MKKPLVIKEYDWIISKVEYQEEYKYLPEDRFKDLENFILENKQEEEIGVVEFLNVTIKKRLGRVICAKNYVGIIQMKEGTQIEILPKIYCQDNLDNYESTRKIFISMLKSLRNFPAKVFNESSLKTDSMNLYEVFINMYIQEVHYLAQKGLKSNYVSHSDNEKFYKGKILFGEQIKHNLIHKERFFIRYDEFNINRPENRLIKTTLLKLAKLSNSWSNKKEIDQLLINFELVDASINYKKDYARVQMDRNMKHYKNVIEWSKIFLMNKSFTAFSGNSNARALLFPMEKVFESYIAQQMKKHLAQKECSISVQDKSFYLFDIPSRFALRPDIVIESENKKIVLDTKWKLLDENSKYNYDISQGDMYQMYAYAKKYNVEEVFLIYPYNKWVHSLSDKKIKYTSNDNVAVNILFVDLLNIDISMDELICRIGL